jgi:hypothetical protein
MKNNIESDFPPFGNPKSESASAQLGISHRRSGLQIADVIANTFFNRAMATERQGRMAAIVAPFLESGKISLRVLSRDTKSD